jgi:redox-sensitive bicupin YhaK (pirin superfamily)
MRAGWSISLLDGIRGPIETFADPFAAHVTFAPAGTAELSVPPGIDLGLYVIAGKVRVDRDAARPHGPHGGIERMSR